LLRALAKGEVEFILVGGALAARALRPLAPYLRGAPPALPFEFDEQTLRRRLNVTLTTTLGDIDLLGEIAGGGGYKNCFPTVSIFIFSTWLAGV
jgi:hypothetical protein